MISQLMTVSVPSRMDRIPSRALAPSFLAIYLSRPVPLPFSIFGRLSVSTSDDAYTRITRTTAAPTILIPIKRLRKKFSLLELIPMSEEEVSQLEAVLLNSRISLSSGCSRKRSNMDSSSVPPSTRILDSLLSVPTQLQLSPIVNLSSLATSSPSSPKSTSRVQMLSPSLSCTSPMTSHPSQELRICQHFGNSEALGR